jgi:hypothetical protein
LIRGAASDFIGEGRLIKVFERQSSSGRWFSESLSYGTFEGHRCGGWSLGHDGVQGAARQAGLVRWHQVAHSSVGATNGGSATIGCYSGYFSGNPNNTTASFFKGFSSTSTNRISIWSNGNIQNSNNSYGSLSDEKLKENIVDATPKLSDLMQVRIRNYNLKYDPEHKQIGVIAQELEPLFPGMIDETSDIDMEGNDLGTTTKSVKYSVFVPMLIKAIQEQQTIINDIKTELDTVKAELATLKGAPQ